MSIAINKNLPILGNEGGLSAYLDQIKKFPMLDAEEEYMLAKNWKIIFYSGTHKQFI